MVINCGGINWRWYVFGEHTAEGFRIDWHGRIHLYDMHPKTDEYGALIEDDGRIVRSIRIGNEVYPVANPKHVFNYTKEKDHV